MAECRDEGVPPLFASYDTIRTLITSGAVSVLGLIRFAAASKGRCCRMMVASMSFLAYELYVEVVLAFRGGLRLRACALYIVGLLGQGQGQGQPERGIRDRDQDSHRM
jgi:hypothetical protein